MSAPYALLALLAIVAAVVVANLLGGLRGRRRVLSGEAYRKAGADDPLVDWIAELRQASGPDHRPTGADHPAPADHATPAVRVAPPGRATPVGGVATTPATGAVGASAGRQAERDVVFEAVAPPALPAVVRVAAAHGTSASGREPGGGAQWALRNVADRPAWSWPVGGHPGPSRPAGPARPPARRDPRRPAGTPAPTAAPRRPDRRQTAPAGGESRSGVRGLSPRRTLLLAGLTGTATGLLLAGPVAAVALGGYGTLAVRAVLRRQSGRRADRARRHRLDQLCGLAADLRAGLPVPVAAERLTLGQPGPPAGSGRDDAIAGDGRRDGSDRLERLARAAVRLADRTGAPLAELLERIEADARSSDRGLAAADAQAAGARATALLLAALPLGGIGLGYGIGVDPVAVLLHTPVGGACAVAAVVLQVAGLFWAERLGATSGRVA
ncbi:hypothetical protein ACWENR_16925 [Micromonospora sp. NPDC004336]